MTEYNPTPKTPKGGSQKNLIILLLLLFIATLIFSIWQNNKINKLEENIVEKTNTVSELTTHVDSLDLMLNDYEERLIQLEKDKEQITNYSEDLELQITNLKNTITGLRKKLANADPKEIERLKKEILTIGNQTAIYENQIAQLIEENNQLKQTTEELNVENKALTDVNQSLDKKIKKAAVALYGSLKVQPGYLTRKNIFEPSDRARKIEQLMFNVDVIENALVDSPIEEKITIRVIDPNQIVITKSMDNQTLVDKSELSTLTHVYDYSGKYEKITMKFSEDRKYVKGKYKVEMLIGGVLKQTTSFELK